MSTQTDSQCMTLRVKDIQKILGIGQVSAYNLIHSNSFPVTKIGKNYRIPQKPFFQWMERQEGVEDTVTAGCD